VSWRKVIKAVHHREIKKSLLKCGTNFSRDQVTRSFVTVQEENKKKQTKKMIKIQDSGTNLAFKVLVRIYSDPGIAYFFELRSNTTVKVLN